MISKHTEFSYLQKISFLSWAGTHKLQPKIETVAFQLSSLGTMPPVIQYNIFQLSQLPFQRLSCTILPTRQFYWALKLHVNTVIYILTGRTKLVHVGPENRTAIILRINGFRRKSTNPGITQWHANNREIASNWRANLPGLNLLL